MSDFVAGRALPRPALLVPGDMRIDRLSLGSFRTPHGLETRQAHRPASEQAHISFFLTLFGMGMGYDLARSETNEESWFNRRLARPTTQGAHKGTSILTPDV